MGFFFILNFFICFCFFIFKKKNALPCGGRAECYSVISSRACKCTGGIIISVAVRSWASRFKHLRIYRRLTRGGRPILATATVLRLPKSLASTLASSAVPGPQLSRALLIQVGHAPRRQTRARPATRVHDHLYIVPVYQAHIVEVLRGRCDCEFGKSSRWVCSGAIAFDLVGATVPGGAAALASVRVESAAGSSPESSGPVGRGLEGAGPTRLEFESGAF